MKKLVVGQILRDGKIMGTGFLVSSDIVMTVKHNIITADELLTDELEEKEVVFRKEDSDEVAGKTVNLLEAIEKGIDCVLIRLNEVLSEDEMYDLVDVENEIVGVGCQVVGFPKLVQKKAVLFATVINEQEGEIIVNVKKENQLQNYEGLSGAPIIILGNIVGVIAKQENSERLEALAIKYIKKVLRCEEVSIKKKEIPISISEEQFNLSSLKQKVEQVISMVGPRYSKDLNIKTGTYSNLNFMLKQDGIAERLQDISSQIKDCIKKLLEFASYNQDEDDLVLEESRLEIDAIVNQLQIDSVVLDSGSYEEDKLMRIFEHLKECEQNLIKVFEVEKRRFEEKKRRWNI